MSKFCCFHAERQNSSYYNNTLNPSPSMISFINFISGRYSFVEKDKRQQKAQKFDFIHNFCEANINQYNWIKVDAYKTFHNNIAMIHIVNKNCENNLTLLISKSCSHDLGSFFPIAVDLSTQLKINIIAYDYSGYGESGGEPSNESIMSNIDEVLTFSILKLGNELERTIIFGQSIGSFPSIYLCSNIKYNRLRGLILLSPYCLENKLEDKKAKKYYSLSKEQLKAISCPVLLIHGMIDSIIPLKGINKISKLFNKIHTWYPTKGNHNNIIRIYRTEFLNQIKLFIKSIIFYQKNSSISLNFKFEFDEDVFPFNSNFNDKKQNDNECLLFETNEKKDLLGFLGPFAFSKLSNLNMDSSTKIKENPFDNSEI